MLHHSRKHQRRRKRYRQRIGYRQVMLLKCVLLDMQMQRVVKVSEKSLTQMVTLTYDDRILVGQIAQRRECRAKHRVGRHKRMPAIGIKLRQARLYRCYVTKYRPLGQSGHHRFKCRKRIFHRRRIDHHFRLKRLDFVKSRETQHIKSETQPLGIDIIDCHLMVARKHIGEKRAHLARTKYKYLHRLYRLSTVEYIYLLAHRLFMYRR